MYWTKHKSKLGLAYHIENLKFLVKESTGEVQLDNRKKFFPEGGWALEQASSAVGWCQALAPGAWGQCSQAHGGFLAEGPGAGL